MKSARSRSRNLKPLWVCLFGIPFLAAGIAIIVSGLVQWKRYFESASWDRVDAAIESVSLESHRGSKGGTTYSVQCAYSYTYQGKTYTGHRVGAESEGSSSSFHRRRQQVLQEHLNEKKPFRAWVNPADLSESLLFREQTGDLYFDPLFGLIFAVVGAGVVFAGLWEMTAGKRSKNRLAQYPDRPWRVDGSWDDFTIRAHKFGIMIGRWVMGILLSIFLCPFFIGFASMENRPFFVWVILVPFAVAALWLLGKAGYATLQYLKYGNPMLTLSQLPIVPGTRFLALLLVKRQLVTEYGIHLTFKCVKTTVTGSGKYSSTDTEDVHSETKTITKDMVRIADEGSIVPVAFDVPTGLPDRENEGNPSYEWKLEAKAKTAGIDFSAEFDLPVYTVTDQSLEEKQPAGMAQRAAAGDGY